MTQQWRYTGREWIVPVPAGTPLLTMNQRYGHWSEQHRRTQALKEAAHWMVKAGKWPRIERAHVILELVIPDRRRMDPLNWAPTAKALLDGVVASGMLDDDDRTRVLGPDIRQEGHANAKLVKNFPGKRPPIEARLRIREME